MEICYKNQVTRHYNKVLYGTLLVVPSRSHGSFRPITSKQQVHISWRWGGIQITRQKLLIVHAAVQTGLGHTNFSSVFHNTYMKSLATKLKKLSQNRL